MSLDSVMFSPAASLSYAMFQLGCLAELWSNRFLFLPSLPYPYPTLLTPSTHHDSSAGDEVGVSRRAIPAPVKTASQPGR